MIRRFVIATCFAAWLLPLTVQAQANNQQVARLEQIVTSYTKNDAFMGTVLVTKGDEVLLNKGYGRALLEWGIPNAPDVKFRLGSDTKQFTAALVLLLQQDGKLNVNDSVGTYLACSPDAWRKITLSNLLNHTSGIPNFTVGPNFRPWSRSPHTPAEIIAFFRDRPLEFEPGAKYSYSNSNYEVLGAVLEKVSGKKYGDLLQDRILKPLGMHDTGLDEDGLVLTKRAQGYTRGPNGFRDAVSESMSIPWAAGGMYSTTADLLLWEHGLFGGKVLNAASLKQMTTPGLGEYGFGVTAHSEGGVTVVTHGGSIEGFTSDLTYVPEKKIAVLVLCNLNSSTPRDMATELLKAMLGEQ